MKFNLSIFSFITHVSWLTLTTLRMWWYFPSFSSRSFIIIDFMVRISWINFSVLFEVGIKNQLVLCWYQNFPVVFVKKNIISLWNYLGSFVENKLIVYTWVYLWSIFFPLVYLCVHHIYHTDFIIIAL